MTKKIMVFIIAATIALLSACGWAGAEQPVNLPEVHPIEYDASLETLNDEYGADAVDHALDHADTKYYVINDYYNMTSEGGLHILPNFRTYQQTALYTCGAAAALMVLEHYGNHDYNELDISRLAGTDMTKGTSVEGLADFFKSIGWEITYHADTDRRFQSIEECEDFFITMLDSGTPIMVDWEDWSGHWQVLIGLDSCGSDNPFDDVLILADPYDITDHYQDGYYIFPLGRFFDMWREGPCAGKTEPYQQPFVVAVPAQE